MIIEPRVRGFICTTAHPVGCATNVREQIAYVLRQGSIPECPEARRRAGVFDAVTASQSRIVATFAGGAETIGVSLEREPSASRTGSAGWYNNRAFEIEAEKDRTISPHARGRRLLQRHEENLHRPCARKVRTARHAGLQHGRSGPDRPGHRAQTYRSAIKPLGAPVEIKTLNTETGEVFETTIAPASEDEAAATVAVMGGEDWKRWIDQLADAGVLAPGFRTLNYTYIGSELTWPIYWHGTLGRAKVDLDRKAEAIRGRLGQDAARVVALKAVVTQASSAIPVVPLYGTVLFKVMKQLGLARRLHRTDRPPVPHAPWQGCRS